MIFSSRQDSFLSTPFLKDNLIRLNLFFSLLANFLLWLFLIWQVKSFSNLIFLHYNIYFGIDRLGEWHEIFILPALGLVFLIANFIFAKLTFDKEKILSYFLASAGSFLQLLFISASVFIILINTKS